MWLGFYRETTRLIGPFLPLFLKHRLTRGKEDAARLNERFGEAGTPRPDGGLIWFHGASVGESVAILPILSQLRRYLPQVTLLVTTGTVTSAKLMSERLPDGALHQYVPLDRPAYVRRFLDHWKPNLAVWVESEFWPNLVMETKSRRIPMAVVNGRISQKSFKAYTRCRSLIAPVLGAFDLCLVQDDMEAERFRKLGADKVEALGNLKFAAQPLPVDRQEFMSFDYGLEGRPRWLLASSFEGEEQMAAAVHSRLKRTHPDLLTIIVPRHAHRGDAVFESLAAAGLEVAQRSKNQQITAKTDIYLADTMGELGLFYRLVPIVCIGKSFTEKGGQNLLEPALLGKAILHGPHMDNFAAITRDMLAAKISWQVEDDTELADAIAYLLTNPVECRQRGEQARQYAQSQARVLEDTLDALAPMLEPLVNARA